MFLTEEVWRETFLPAPVPGGEPGDFLLEKQNTASEAIAAGHDESLVWTEYLDYSHDDDDHSIITNGFFPSTASPGDLLGWYVCTVPWTAKFSERGSAFVQVEW